MEKVRPWCGQPSDRGRLKNRTEQIKLTRVGFRAHVKIASRIVSYSAVLAMACVCPRSSHVYISSKLMKELKVF